MKDTTDLYIDTFVPFAIFGFVCVFIATAIFILQSVSAPFSLFSFLLNTLIFGTGFSFLSIPFIIISHATFILIIKLFSLFK